MAVLEDLLVKLGFKVNPEGLDRANQLLEGMNHKLELIAGIEVVRGLAELVERFSHFGDALEQAAFQAGITAESFQKLVYAGSQFNVSQDQIQMALGKMSRLLQNARDGSKGAVEQFAKLGISQDQIAQFNNAEDAFYAVQDALAAIPDSFRRVAATQAIFGRGAVALTKFAASGSQASRALGKEAVRMGAVVKNEGVEGLAEFEDAMQGLGLTMRAFMASIAAAFAPALKAVVKDVQGLIGANSQLIQQNLEAWAERTAFVLGAVVEFFRILTGAVTEYIATHPRLITFATKTAAVLLGMSVASGVLKTAFGGLRSILTIISAAVSLLGGRITLIMVAVAGLLLGLKAMWDVFHGVDFKDTTFAKSLGWMKDYAMDAGKALKESLGGYEQQDREMALGLPPVRNVPTYELAHRKKMPSIEQAMNSIGSAGVGVQTLNQSAVRRGEGLPAGAAVGSSSTHNVSVNNNISMAFHGPTDAKEMRKSMEKVADEVFTRAAERTHRDHLPAAAR